MSGRSWPVRGTRRTLTYDPLRPLTNIRYWAVQFGKSPTSTLRPDGTLEIPTLLRWSQFAPPLRPSVRGEQFSSDAWVC
jgi:hypothetical protein